MSNRVLRRPAVRAKLGLADSSFDDLRRRDPTFPRAIRLGARTVGFFEEEIDAWLFSRPRDDGNAPAQAESAGAQA